MVTAIAAEYGLSSSVWFVLLANGRRSTHIGQWETDHGREVIGKWGWNLEGIQEAVERNRDARRAIDGLKWFTHTGARIPENAAIASGNVDGAIEEIANQARDGLIRCGPNGRRSIDNAQKPEFTAFERDEHGHCIKGRRCIHARSERRHEIFLLCSEVHPIIIAIRIDVSSIENAVHAVRQTCRTCIDHLSTKWPRAGRDGLRGNHERESVRQRIEANRTLRHRIELASASRTTNVGCGDFELDGAQLGSRGFFRLSR